MEAATACAAWNPIRGMRYSMDSQAFLVIHRSRDAPSGVPAAVGCQRTAAGRRRIKAGATATAAHDGVYVGLPAPRVGRVTEPRPRAATWSLRPLALKLASKFRRTDGRTSAQVEPPPNPWAGAVCLLAHTPGASTSRGDVWPSRRAVAFSVRASSAVGLRRELSRATDSSAWQVVDRQPSCGQRSSRKGGYSSRISIT